MASYQFDGSFQDTSWNTMPSPTEVVESVERAIKGARTNVFSINVERADVTAFGDELRDWRTLDWPKASIVVTWEVPDDD